MKLFKWRGIFCIFVVSLLLPISALKNENACSCNIQKSKFPVYMGVMSYVPEITEKPSEKPAIGDPPSYFSWMNYNGEDWTTPARYQGMCGSCWDFAAVGALESVINIAEGVADLDPDLSEQYILSCLPSAGSCRGGSPYLAYMYIKSTSSDGNYYNGIVTESCFPYEADDTVPCTAKCPDWKSNLVPIADYGYWLPDGSDEDRDRIKTMIMEKGPVVTFMMATEDFMEWGLYNHDPEDYYEYPGYVEGINHCVVIVGWKDDASINHGGYWICKNSWGSYWGYNGFFNIEYGSLHIDDYSIVWVEYDADSFDWPPVANAGGPYTGKVGEEITFDGSKSHDAEGYIVEWHWDFGDGATSNEQKPKHVYNERGLYTVTLTVTDESGKQKSDKTAVFVDLWKEEDEWIFDIGEIILDMDFASFDGSMDGFDLKVSNAEGGYKLDFNGKIEGDFRAFVPQLAMNVSGKLFFNRLQGGIYVREDDFGVERAEATFKGIAIIRLEAFPIPLPLPFGVEMNMEFNPAFTLIDFPLEIGKDWIIPSSDMRIDATASVLFGIISIPIQYELSLGSMEGKCTGKEIIGVEAGTYEAYKISLYDMVEFYFAPEVANIIKLSISYEGVSVQAELKETNYE